MPENWARNCWTGVGTKQVTALQVGEQIGR
jgi:hypothetical protein